MSKNAHLGDKSIKKLKEVIKRIVSLRGKEEAMTETGYVELLLGQSSIS